MGLSGYPGSLGNCGSVEDTFLPYFGYYTIYIYIYYIVYLKIQFSLKALSLKGVGIPALGSEYLRSSAWPGVCANNVKTEPVGLEVYS